MGLLPPTIAVVTQPTRLAGLVARWATRSAAQFRIKQAVIHEHAIHAPRSRRSSRRLRPAPNWLKTKRPGKPRSQTTNKRTVLSKAQLIG